MKKVKFDPSPTNVWPVRVVDTEDDNDTMATMSVGNFSKRRSRPTLKRQRCESTALFGLLLHLVVTVCCLEHSHRHYHLMSAANKSSSSSSIPFSSSALYTPRRTHRSPSPSSPAVVRAEPGDYSHHIHHDTGTGQTPVSHPRPHYHHHQHPQHQHQHHHHQQQQQQSYHHPEAHQIYQHGSSPRPMHAPSLPNVPYVVEPAHPNPDVALANVIAEKLAKNKTTIVSELLKKPKKVVGADKLHLSPISAHAMFSDAPVLPPHKPPKGLMSPASPFYLAPQDPLLNEDPIRSNPVLMNFMHLNTDPQAFSPFHAPGVGLDDQTFFDESLFAKYPMLYDPQMRNPYEDVDHLHPQPPPGHGAARHLHHHLDQSNTLPLAPSYHFHTHDTDNYINYDMIQEHPKKKSDNVVASAPPPPPPPASSSMSSGEASKRAAAQDMLFAKHYNYYTPFKVNTINVYAKYLAHGNEKCGKGGKMGKLSSGDIEAAMKQAGATVNWYQDTVNKNGVETKRKTPYIPSNMLDAKLFEYASAYLKKRKCYNKMDVIKMMPKLDSRKYVSRYNMPVCKSYDRLRCDPKAKYRNIDGSCNNLKIKTWAKSFTCHRRLLPPDYADGISAPRIAYDGSKLPNARDLSSLLLPDISVVDHKLTSMVMSFGQFIVHDITRTLPMSNDIKCCPTKKAVHPECMGIEINQKDDFLTKTYNQTCLNFVRSTICNPCSLGPREQQNQATHTFDMSHMYGLRLNDSIPLRTLRGGKLRSSWTSTYPKGELPPKMKKEDRGCNVRPHPPRFKCFESSDGIRASQHPALQALHAAFHRRHNQHASALAKVNPHWGDEKLYQETRRIIIAELTKITYDEYVPSIFGKKLTDHFRLGLKHKGYTKYDSKLNPNTIQEFIVAAGRFGHSQINDQFKVMFEDKKMSYSFSLKDNFFETTIVSLGHSGGILKGLAMESTEATDPYFVDDIKNFLYKLRREKLGRDLPAFNIQRGRDHGIPGYIYYLDFCFGYKVKSWKDLVTFIPKKQLKKIQVFYKHYKDIDLFVGGISERLISGAAFGPTFACINGIQFYNWKYGDRFYFEHGHQAGSFTPAQLDNIRKVSSMSQLICKTNKEIKYMPANSFFKPSMHYNPIKTCHSFGELDYGLWAEKGGGGKYKYGGGMKKQRSMPKPVHRAKSSNEVVHAGEKITTTTSHRVVHNTQEPPKYVRQFYQEYSQKVSPDEIEKEIDDGDFFEDEPRPNIDADAQPQYANTSRPFDGHPAQRATTEAIGPRFENSISGPASPSPASVSQYSWPNFTKVIHH